MQLKNDMETVVLKFCNDMQRLLTQGKADEANLLIDKIQELCIEPQLELVYKDLINSIDEEGENRDGMPWSVAEWKFLYKWARTNNIKGESND